MNALITHAQIIAATPRQLLIPRIGYANLFREGAVSASSENAAHPKELAFDGLTYDAWLTTGAASEWIAVELAAPTESDYMAIARHTLGGCTLTPQSSDNGIDWDDLHAPFVAADGRPIVWEYDTAEAPHKRLLIENATGPVSLGAIHCGMKLELAIGLPVGWLAPSLNERIEYSNPISVGGQSLGRSVVRRGASAQVATDPVDYVFAREDWEAFRAAADLYAFFFWWAMQGKGEIVYGGLEVADARFPSPGRVATSFRIAGINR